MMTQHGIAGTSTEQTRLRLLVAGLFAVIVHVPWSGGAQVPSLSTEPNTDRGGAVLRNTNLATPNPALCLSLCASDARCKSYTYVKPGVQGPKARCWLKSSLAGPRRNTCCTSGVKLATPLPQQALELAQPTRATDTSVTATSVSASLKGPSSNLIKVASIKLEVCGEGRCDNEATRAMWTSSIVLGGVGPQEMTFRWATKASGVTGLKWEISSSGSSPGAAPLAQGVDKSKGRSFTVSMPFLKNKPAGQQK